MDSSENPCEIRAALCFITDKAEFLLRLKEVSRQFQAHIICFNADMLAGRRHAEMAVYHAVRSFERGDSISNTLEMEALLYAAGSRQCNVGASFGIHNGENHLWICCIPSPEGVWQALEREFSFLQDNSWDQINGEKRDLLMKLFRIPQTELASLESPCRIRDLVLERVALLEVLR